ncbi:unnamed protein product [Durusdinium trenchii]|uniref:Uncharacterized protein n=1 Tax=Durusdinium trenchii TaxID=1381693 RepID=A0ABP0PC86_9DINO
MAMERGGCRCFAGSKAQSFRRTTLLHVFLRDAMTETIGTGGGIETIWAGYTFILGFLIVFRSNQAYSRFWESVTLTHKIRGQWTNAYSNLLAFCSTDQAREEEVSHFREYLLRLMSLLHCYALHQVCEMSDDRLEVIDLSGLSPDTVDFLHSCTSSDRAETVMLWIERLVVENDQKKLFAVAPPVLSRAFQELSAGMVNIAELKKIVEVPFPFPYSQYLSFMLVLQWLVSPLVACQLISEWWWAASTVWLMSTSYWTLFYIAQEIDQPFGEDSNDLPVVELQHEFNKNLLHLSSSQSYALPDFVSAIAVKRTTCMSMARLTLQSSKLQATSSSGPLCKALEDQLQREEQVEEVLEQEREGRRPNMRNMPEAEEEDCAKTIGQEPPALPVLATHNSRNTLLGPCAIEAAAQRGIQPEQPIELEILQSLVMELAVDYSEPEDIPALIDEAHQQRQTLAAASMETVAAHRVGGNAMSLIELVQHFQDLALELETGGGEERPLAREKKDLALAYLLQLLTGTLKRPHSVRINTI